MNSASGQKLNGRYQIISHLGQGGFGTTFLAEDLHLPDKRKCVVKQLKPQANDPFTLETARRLFDTEAKTLYRLGNHPQIPQLFAYFEENQEFYLVQEYIQGCDLDQELKPGQVKSEEEVISLLQEILQILEFVHQHNVIHRDINPRNLIRCDQDGKLFLIDFGAVKKVSTQFPLGKNTGVTVAIGTPGYQPGEQASGNPKLSSDVYAVGIIGVQALTGCLPHQLPSDSETGEIRWQNQVSSNSELVKVLERMVRYDFRERYPSATQALDAIKDVQIKTVATVAIPGAQAVTPSVTGKGKGKKFPGWIFAGVLSLLLISLGIVTTIFVRHWLNSANANDLYNQGNTFYQLNRYEEALQVYNQALQIRPDYGEAWKRKGDALQELKRYRESLEAYEQAIQIQPDYWEAWLGRGMTLDSLRRYGEAIKAFKKVIELKPKHWEAWNSIGNIQIKLQQYSEAIASFEKVIKLESKYGQAWYQHGWALQNLRRYQEAVKSYDKAVALQPNSPSSWYQRGNSLMNLQKYKEAVTSYKKAVQFRPNFPQAWYSQGIALNHLKKYKEAVIAFDQAVKFKSDYYEAWYHRGWSFHQLKRYEEAISSYDRAIKVKNNDAQVWYNRGNSFYNLNKYPEAISSYDRAIAIKSNHYQAWNSKGNALFNLEKYQNAIASYDQALRHKRDYQEARKGKERAKIELELLQKHAEEEKKKKEEEKKKKEKKKEETESPIIPELLPSLPQKKEKSDI